MENSKISLIFLGTSSFAVPALDLLLKNNFSVIAVVTRPDEPVGREQIITPPPIKIIANTRKIPIFQPEKLTFEYWEKNVPLADCVIVAAYGKLIPADIIGLLRFGAVNIHPSLLPLFRGPSPIQSAILEGAEETGVSIMLLDKLMDHGPILAQKTISLKREKPHYKKLHDILAHEGAKILIHTLPQWFTQNIVPQPQDDIRATFTKLLKKDDGRIDWLLSADEIERKVRAFEVWPGSWTLWATEKKIYRIKIEDADIDEDEYPYGTPGHVWRKKEIYFPLIKTRQGSLILKRLTIEGKKALDAQDFLRGYPQFMGTTLI